MSKKILENGKLFHCEEEYQYKMVKRQRERSVEFEIRDGVVILEQCGRKYIWTPPKNITVDAFLNEDMFEYNIDNYNGKAVFNVENTRKNVEILRQSVSPLETV
jgi:hypothetical protein